jgi:phosphoglycerate kinase
MHKKTVKDIDLKNKKIIMRADFNVPLKDGSITDDTRINAALPTIKYILEQEGSSLILMSHLGRPKGKVVPEMSLKPVASRLSELLGKEVKIAPDCIGNDVKQLTEGMASGDVVLLENLRFHSEETSNDPGFAEQLAGLADIYVNDAFGTAHRAHASTEGIAHKLPAVSGFLIEKEIKFLGSVLVNPEKPFIAIIGGAKVSSKIAVLESLLSKVSTLIIGGGMTFTFLKVKGHEIGNSLFEEDYIDTAKALIENAEKSGVELILPEDHLVGSEFSENAKAEYVDGPDVPEGKIGMDIGEKTLKKILKKLKEAKTIFWNGPLGVTEFNEFANGTLQVAKEAANCNGTTIVGGGDSVAAVNKFGLAARIDHVSTGGGASLEFIEGKTLPGINALLSK